MPTAFVIAFATLREGLPRQRFICSTNMTLQDPIDLLVNGGTPERCLGLCCFLLSSWAALWQPSVMSTTLKDAGAALTKPTSPVEDLISQTKRPGLMPGASRHEQSALSDERSQLYREAPFAAEMVLL